MCSHDMYVHVDHLGQRALVGKVNMDQQSPEDYMEETLYKTPEGKAHV